MAKPFQGTALSLLSSLAIIPGIPVLHPALYKTKDAVFRITDFFFLFPCHMLCLYVWDQNNI